MKTLSFVLLTFLVMIQLEGFANDHSMNEIVIEDEFAEFAAIHFSESTAGNELDCPYSKIIIYDMGANIIRQSEVSIDCLKGNRSILWPIINRSQYLTEVNGVLIYLFDETYR